MRQIFYGAATVVTTGDVADALMQLAVAVANVNQTEAVTIPVILDAAHEVGTAQLILGAGIPLMTAQIAWRDEEPDFSTGAALLHMNSYFPYRDADPAPADAPVVDLESWDPELEGY